MKKETKQAIAFIAMLLCGLLALNAIDQEKWGLSIILTVITIASGDYVSRSKNAEQ
jgi:hypothetical protein